MKSMNIQLVAARVYARALIRNKIKFKVICPLVIRGIKE